MSREHEHYEHVLRPTADLQPYEKNSRLHPPHQLRKLKEAIETFGFTTPLIIDEEDRIICGHGRQTVALEIGLEEVPCIVVTGLTDVERRALVIADNRLSDLGRFDTDLLLQELGELSEDGVDLSSIGYDPSDMDALFHGAGLEPAEDKGKRRKTDGAKKLANQVQRALTVAQNEATAAYTEYQAKADAKDASEASFSSGKAAFGSEVLSWISQFLGVVPDADDVLADL
jgi:hypothetical protein